MNIDREQAKSLGMSLSDITSTNALNGRSQRCHFSRHGTVGSGYNSDFARARRQQFLVMAGADKLVANGSDDLASLLTASKNKVFTNIPRTLDAATQLLGLVDGAHLAKSDTVVFSPSKWAKQNSTTPIYTFRPRLKVVRTWINQHFGS